MTSKKILSFGAHPDDIEIGCGGTEYNLIQSGFEATHVYVTSGEAGSKMISKSDLAAIREKEAIESAKTLGVKAVVIFISLVQPHLPNPLILPTLHFH